MVTSTRIPNATQPNSLLLRELGSTLLLNKIGFLPMEYTLDYTSPPNPSTPAIPLNTITSSEDPPADSEQITMITCPPSHAETISDDVEGEYDASHSGTLKDYTKDVKEDLARAPSTKRGENEKFELADASLRSFPTHEGNEYSSRLRGEDLSLTGLMQHPAASDSSSSCLPSTQMWYSFEEQSESFSASRQTQEEDAIGFEQEAYFSNGGRVWDILQDNENLSRYYEARKNLVLDSIWPNLAPHIVVTPADETWNDQLIAWENRVEPQRMGNLMVSIAYTMWPPPPPVLSLEPITHIDSPSLEGYTPNRTAVFSASKFNKFIESASTERLVLCQLIRALQKQRCRATFFRASTVAQSFRERYDVSLDCFKSLEPPFVWSDPAESILVMCSKLLGTTIIDSPCPFLLPHIIINMPPPQDFWIPWNNALNDPQDQGFGQYLVVPSPAVGLINPAEVSGWESPSSPYFFDQPEDQSESPPTPGTSLPDTPVDERDDLDYFLTRHGDDDGTGTEIDFYYQSLSGLPPIQEEYAEANGTKPSSRPIFSIEEDEDDLPPFDDWYQ